MTVKDFFNTGTGAPSAKFPVIGTAYTGTILSVRETQQTDLDGILKEWDDGKPMMQVEITVQTADRDSEIEEDDGRRRVFVKGQMRAAMGDALHAAGSDEPEVGGQLTVTFASTRPAKKKGFNPVKVYEVLYTPPATSVQTSLSYDEEPF